MLSFKSQTATKTLQTTLNKTTTTTKKLPTDNKFIFIIPIHIEREGESFFFVLYIFQFRKKK